MMQTGLIGGPLADYLLRRPGERPTRRGYCDGSAYRGQSKLEALFGESIKQQIAAAVVADFGGGVAEEAIELVQRGAEQTLIRRRSRFKQDGATRFAEVEGGLNQMTIGPFRRLVARSLLRFQTLEAVPIRRLRALAHPLTREYVTGSVCCSLGRREVS